MESEATSYFFEEVIIHSRANKDQDHIDMIILNHTSLPDRTEAIVTKNTNELVQLLIKDVKILEDLGVDNIAIPCNTSHYFYDQLEEKTNVPIIHMVRETIQYILNEFKDVQKIGILGTNGTIQTGIYHQEGKKLGVDIVSPSIDKQNDIMSLIYDEIKQGKKADNTKFHRAYEDLMQMGSDVIILACTELSVFKKTNKVPDNCVDAMDILVKEAIERSNINYKK